MKKLTSIIVLIFLTINLFAVETWDILDKSMATWNVDGGSANNKAWTTLQKGSGIAVTQETGYVNITKTSASASNNYAFLAPQTLTLSANTAYSIEIKARIRPINKTAFPDVSATFESHQISGRLNNKNMAIFLKYGDENSGYITLTAAITHADTDKFKINTSEWHIYRFVLHADNLMYDVYIDDAEEPVFENIPTTAKSHVNAICLGAESAHRCSIDVEAVKMGTGDFYSKPKITSLTLSSDNHLEKQTKTITVTANSILINDNEKVLVSLVDSEDNSIVNAVEAVVLNNKAVTAFTIPSSTPKGRYFVKVAAPNGKIGDIDISPAKAAYLIATSFFEGKNLITFGNSITSAQNSWAYQTYQKLGFANLYNGAVAGACWYKRARKAQDGDSIWTQDYSDPSFAGMSNETNVDRAAFQRIINNCAVVHIQKYIIDNPNASPDYAILSYGTNDVASTTMGNVAQTMARTLDKVDLYTMAGALRWSIETLQTKFPNLVIYVALPIQAKDATKNNDNLKKIVVIKGICDAMSITYFDCYNESGITQANEAKYLRDGLHPNESGQVVHADYIIKKLEGTASGQSSAIRQEDVSKEAISISANVLNAGKTFTLKSLIEGVPLKEIALYGIAGNTVERKLVSGNEFTLTAPATGLYILTVKLENDLLKTFKILVK